MDPCISKPVVQGSTVYKYFFLGRESGAFISSTKKVLYTKYLGTKIKNQKVVSL